jgi:peptide/nickel transport system permease protein
VLSPADDPGLFVIITTLAFSFLGDGLRDAADPYA